jgi:hypothetical protein
MKSITSTAANMAIAAGGLVGSAGISGAQTVDGSIVSYSGPPVTTSGYDNSVIVFDLVADTASVDGSDSSNYGFGFVVNPYLDDQVENDNGGVANNLTVTEGILTSPDEGVNFVVDLAAGAPIGNASGPLVATAAGQTNNFFLGGKASFSNLNSSDYAGSPFPDFSSYDYTGTATTTGYLGLTIPDPLVSGQQDYGWAEISVNLSAEITLDGFAYDDSGAAILAGEVPEPTSVGMIVLSGAVLAFLARRSRKARLAA